MKDLDVVKEEIAEIKRVDRRRREERLKKTLIEAGIVLLWILYQKFRVKPTRILEKRIKKGIEELYIKEKSIEQSLFEQSRKLTSQGSNALMLEKFLRFLLPTILNTFHMNKYLVTYTFPWFLKDIMQETSDQSINTSVLCTSLTREIQLPQIKVSYKESNLKHPLSLKAITFQERVEIDSYTQIKFINAINLGGLNINTKTVWFINHLQFWRDYIEKSAQVYDFFKNIPQKSIEFSDTSSLIPSMAIDNATLIDVYTFSDYTKMDNLNQSKIYLTGEVSPQTGDVLVQVLKTQMLAVPTRIQPISVANDRPGLMFYTVYFKVLWALQRTEIITLAPSISIPSGFGGIG